MTPMVYLFTVLVQLHAGNMEKVVKYGEKTLNSVDRLKHKRYCSFSIMIWNFQFTPAKIKNPDTRTLGPIKPGYGENVDLALTPQQNVHRNEIRHVYIPAV